jgi:hypothetical protein
MVTTTYRNVTLSASAVLNGHPMPGMVAVRIPGSGDFAAGKGGRVRRNERRAAISAKRSFLLSC